jgi:6-phosphogluconolactonase
MTAFAYVASTESNEIAVLRLDPQSGDLDRVETVSIPGVTTPGNSTPMAVSPDRALLYAGAREQPKIAATFAIDRARGTLTHVASGPLDDSMAFIAVDRTGRYLLGASYPGHKITVSRIGSAGAVEPPHQVLEGQPNAHSIGTDATNRYVVAATLGNDLVNVFAFDATSGRLSPHATARLPEKAGPRHFWIPPGGRHLYVLGETDAAVYLFDFDGAAGERTSRQRVSALPPDFQGKPAAADLHGTPDGRFLYASERRSSTLAGFAVEPASGRLKPIGSVPTERQPRGFAIDPTGRYLLAAGQLSHAVTVYRIDPANGTLEKRREYPMGRNPNWIEIVDLP